MLPSFPALLSDPIPLYRPTPQIDNLIATENVEDEMSLMENMMDELDGLMTVQEQMFLEAEAMGSAESHNPGDQGEQDMSDKGYLDVKRARFPL
jgi:hypothetical protein